MDHKSFTVWNVKVKVPMQCNNKDKYLKPNSYKYVSSHNILPPYTTPSYAPNEKRCRALNNHN